MFISVAQYGPAMEDLFSEQTSVRKRFSSRILSNQTLKNPRGDVEGHSFPTEVPGTEALPILGKSSRSGRQPCSHYQGETSLTTQRALQANAQDMTLYPGLRSQKQTSQDTADFELWQQFGVCSRRGGWGQQGPSITIDKTRPSIPQRGRTGYLHKNTLCFLLRALNCTEILLQILIRSVKDFSFFFDECANWAILTELQ